MPPPKRSTLAQLSRAVLVEDGRLGSTGSVAVTVAWVDKPETIRDSDTLTALSSRSHETWTRPPLTHHSHAPP